MDGNQTPVTSNQQPANNFQDAQQTVASGVMPQPPAQPAPPPVGSVHKEALPPQKAPEMVPLVEVNKDRELEPEVEGWIEHLKQEGEIKLAEPIKDEQGNVVMAEAPAQVVNDKIVVPMTQGNVKANLKKPVSDSARWLAEWITRLVKMFGDKVTFKKA